MSGSRKPGTREGLRIGIGPFPLEREPGRSLHEIYGEMLAHAERAEGCGLDGVWVDGNHFTEEAHGPSPLLAAAALAARTRRVSIGVATLSLSFAEHPLLVAEEALVLDALSAGRLILGVGLGYRLEEFSGFGVPPETRRARFDEALALLRGAFQEPACMPPEGRHFPVGAAVTPEPRPVRPGGPPIWVGGGWQPGAVRRIARLGLPLLSQFFERPALLARKLRLYADCVPPDAPGASTVPVIRDVLVADPDAVGPLLARVYARYAAWGMPLLEGPTRPDEIGPAEALEIAVVGSEREVGERLAELAELGVTEVLARVQLAGIPTEVSVRTIEALGRLRSAASSRAPGGAG